MDRREFLKKAGGGLAAAVVAPHLMSKAGAEPITADKRGYVAGKFALELDGQTAGWLHSAGGGYATADVISEKLGPDHITHKHLAGVKYDEIDLVCGTGMSKAFYDWIKAAFDHQYQRKNGAIVGADYNYKEMQRMNFFNALITEIGFPTLDAASKDPAMMTVSISPEYTRVVQGGGKVNPTSTKDNTIQKRWLPSNFKLTIAGLEEACSRVNKIEALVLKQKVVQNPVGELRDYQKEPANLEVPNLVITVPESHAAPFYQWHEDFVIKGNNGQEKERGGTLDFLSPNMQEVLFTLTLQNLGIFNMTPERVESMSENIRRVKVSMYCENMKFDYKPGVVA